MSIFGAIAASLGGFALRAMAPPQAAVPSSPRKEPGFNTAAPRPQNYGLVNGSDASILELFGAMPTHTGRPVTELTAMQVSAVFACVRLIAGTIASLEVDVYSRDRAGQKQKINTIDDMWWLLNEQPHQRWSASNFWKAVVRNELLRGDGLAEILRNRDGKVLGLRPINRTGTEIYLENDRLRYYFSRDDGARAVLDQDDILHFPGFGFDGIRGMSAISWGARNGIGIAIATDEFSGRFFGSGAQVRHAIKTAGKMRPDQVDAIREAWNQHYGGLDNAYKPLVLTEGLDVTELSLNAEDSQLLKSRKFQVIDIARAFGVPPILIGETEKTSSWGSGIEQIVLAYVKFALAERLITIEQELNRKLFRTAEKFVKFNADDLLRGDSAARAKFLRELVGGSQGPGIVTINEARAAEGMMPIKGGDALYSPTPLPGATGAPPPGAPEPPSTGAP